jgi:hypothetical protein
MLFQQGHPADRDWEEAVRLTTENVRRHHPHCNIRTVSRVQEKAHETAGEYLVEMLLDGDLTAVDLTDPEDVRARQVAAAQRAMSKLDLDAQAEVMNNLAGS